MCTNAKKQVATTDRPVCDHLIDDKRRDARANHTTSGHDIRAIVCSNHRTRQLRRLLRRNLWIRQPGS